MGAAPEAPSQPRGASATSRGHCGADAARTRWAAARPASRPRCLPAAGRWLGWWRRSRCSSFSHRKAGCCWLGRCGCGQRGGCVVGDASSSVAGLERDPSLYPTYTHALGWDSDGTVHARVQDSRSLLLAASGQVRRLRGKSGPEKENSNPATEELAVTCPPLGLTSENLVLMERSPAPLHSSVRFRGLTSNDAVTSVSRWGLSSGPGDVRRDRSLGN